jgi:hypothetical protein
MRYGRFLPAMMMAAALLLAGAGQMDAQQPPTPQQQQQVEVTDELLERFVDVYPDMYNINQAAEQELANVTDPAEAQAIQARAQSQMIATLEEGEISVPEYEAVVQALNTDEELRAKFEEMMEEDPPR